MRIVVLWFCIVCSALLIAQQSADTTFAPSNRIMSFSSDDRPIVLIDEAHHNFHTMDGRYNAFRKVLESDGYIVKPNTNIFNVDSLRIADILVIANALHEDNTTNWNLPNFSAFSRNEIEAVYEWVKDGGNLLLIADHMPFPAAADDLAAIFGFQFNNGFAVDPMNRAHTIFSRMNQSLIDHPITTGRNNSERIDSVRTFTGQAFLIPYKAKPVLQFGKHFVSYMPSEVWTFDNETPNISVMEWFQGATLEFYDGRIAIFGEAAMFTAQYNQNNNMWFGLKAEGAEQNEQFLLNVMHWLSNMF